MLIPIADVPRWFAERKPKDTIAISHGTDLLTWEQLERNANRRARALALRSSCSQLSVSAPWLIAIVSFGLRSAYQRGTSAIGINMGRFRYWAS